jgi:hypothetical protein
VTTPGGRAAVVRSPAAGRSRAGAWTPERYRRLWIPVHELYERHSGAPGLADVVVDDNDPAHPRLERAGG